MALVEASSVARGAWGCALPHGNGKKVRVAVFAQGEKADEAKAGEVQYRVEKNGIVHAGIAKASFSEDKIYDNAKMFIETIIKAKPQSVKGTYLKKISLSSTQGVGVKVDSQTL